jgi:hypothetical protein
MNTASPRKSIGSNNSKMMFKKCKTSTLMKGLICVAGIYIGWFVFLIQNFDSLADNHSNNNVNSVIQGTKFSRRDSGNSNANAKASIRQFQNINLDKDKIGDEIDDDEINDDDVKVNAKDNAKNNSIVNNIRKSKVNDDQKWGKASLAVASKEDKKRNDMVIEKKEGKLEEQVEEQVEIEVDVEAESQTQEATCFDYPSSTTTTSDSSSSSTPTKSCANMSKFKFDRSKAEQAIQAQSKKTNQRIKPLTAYVEDKMDDHIPDSGKIADFTNKHDNGIPDKYKEPLPLRAASTGASPEKLHMFQYPKVDSCHKLPSKLPTDAGLLVDDKGKFIYPNVHNSRKHIDVLEYAKYCPVDADPYLPWIHDVFPSFDGKNIHFIAQNKRRCNTGRGFVTQLNYLLPQVALLQPVSVARIDNKEATDVAPELWIPDKDKDGSIDDRLGLPRYKLVPYDDADVDGDFTRFICRFHTLQYDEKTQDVKDVILGETLSTYPANYEYVNYRKRKASMMTPKGKDNGLFWLSNLRFDCPVPENGNLQSSIGLGESVLDDGTPSIYVDVIPIRTSPRFGYENALFPEKLAGKDFYEKKSYGMQPIFPFNRTKYGFDASIAYGDNNVLPRVEASGRWENIPICAPPPPPPVKSGADESKSSAEASSKDVVPIQSKGAKGGKKQHTLSACLWASATFHTRGNDRMVTDTLDRIKEWLEYHLLVGFDHVYIFDNTGAHTDEITLEEVLKPFPETQVTRIDWPSICCNNNKPGDENTGERSSQYAAESSCRQRYGQNTEWIANIDTDEYLVPMGKFNDMREVVDAATKEGTGVLSFRSTRAYPNYDFMEKHYNGGECGKEDNPLCLRKRDNATFLETYNCDFTPLPKPDWSDRAKKQIYRPDYVLSHFVHYATITNDILTTHSEAAAEKKRWNQYYNERDKSERFTDEVNEAVMVHTKTTVPGNTKGFPKYCKFGFVETWKAKCRVGFPIPNNKLDVNASRPDGYKYNCYTNDKLTNTLIPKLLEAMNKRN